VAGVATAAYAFQTAHGFNPSMLDTDGDGVISAAELDTHADQLFARADQDRNGQLSAEERRAFHASMQAMMHGRAPVGHGETETAGVTTPAQFREGFRRRAAALDADRDGRAMERMIDDILTLARTGRSAEALMPVEVRALIAEIVAEYAAQGADVSLEAGPDVVWAPRRDLLTRAVRNLIDNAVRYAGAARLRLTTEEDRLIIRVEDDGPGVPEDRLAEVLRPFTRLDRSRNRRTGGAGLGLAIALSVARLHGGGLALSNRPERGLSAALWLGAADDPTRA
jgi:signal transduction histidine kinase